MNGMTREREQVMRPDRQSETTRAHRVHLGLFGRCNAGKSSLCNALVGHDVSLVSPEPGTTADPVEKVMEMAPLGPVVLHDTAGLDDVGTLGERRARRALDEMRGVDMALLVVRCPSAGVPSIGPAEERAVAAFAGARVPFGVVVNIEAGSPKASPVDEAAWEAFAEELDRVCARVSAKKEEASFKRPPVVRVRPEEGSWSGLEDVRALLAALAPRVAEPPLLRDLLPCPAARLVLVCPQDTGAPTGRLIMPQVRAIREALDGRALCLVVTEKECGQAVRAFGEPPHLVVCDSQVVRAVAEATPEDVPLTTFSILMARAKGDLVALARGAAALTRLVPGDRVIVQEACTHHAQKDDIGRVKIPRLLDRLAGGKVDVTVLSGRHWTDYEGEAGAVVHCGGCALTRREMDARLREAARRGIPMTNYGMALSLGSGLLQRTLAPFPEALAAFAKAREGSG